MTRSNKANTFRSLHIKGDPLVLYNIWDAGSARVIEQAGAKAIATGSDPVAKSKCYDDGEQIPLKEALTNVARIVSQTDLPVSMDFEGGYGVSEKAITSNVFLALETGVVGFNFEDQIVGSNDIYQCDVQIKRIVDFKRAIEDSGHQAFLNCRTDLFLKAPRENHDSELLKTAIERAKSYIDAGADGFFAPNLVDQNLIAELCDALPVPVNIIALPGCPPKSLLKTLGVSRISYGPIPYRKVMAVLHEEAQKAYQ